MLRSRVTSVRLLKGGLRSLWLLGGLMSGLPAAACAQSVDTTMWSCDRGGRVLAIAREGNTIYIGGNFAYVGPSTGGGVPIDVRSVTPLPRYPRVVGRVNTVLNDGEGGWYVGGEFSHVGNLPRANLAHILADGTVAAWAPDPDQQVWALAAVGQTLYVGGDFNFVGGEPRAHLAALGPASSAALPWRCDINSRVTALVASGPTLYVGGWFAYVAGQPRSRVAAVDLASGLPTPLQVSIDDQVKALALHDTTLYIGGYFWTVNGEPRRCLAAVGAESGALHAWDPALERTPISSIDGGPHVNALLVSGQSLYVAGTYSKLGGQARRGLTQLDLSTARATAWNPRAFGGGYIGVSEFYSLVRSGDTLFVAGWFDSLGGQPGRIGGRAGAVSVATGARIDWDPDTNDLVMSLALQGSVMYLGGGFTSVGEWVERHGLAAMDATTGRVTDWDPRPSSYVKSLLVHGGKVYVGGYFSWIGGQPRYGIAALDPETGEATSWNPGADWAVWSMAPLGNTVVAGGIFSWIGGRSQRGLAAIDTSTGLATTWNPHAGGDVYSVAVSDSVIYVGGDFLTMGGQPRNSLAALDPVTGMATPWNPETDGSIGAMTLLNGTIYVGGWFHTVNGVVRHNLAAIDRFGAVTSWVADAFGPGGYGNVQALAAADSTVYAGGFFTWVAGQPRPYFAALDATTGALRPEYPQPDDNVWSLAASNGIVYVGGGFTKMSSWPQVNFAAINPPEAPSQPTRPGLALAQCAPNPVRDNTVIRYALPADQWVSLSVFDLQGRLIAKLLSRELQTAGLHDVPVSTAGWRPGCYLYRLEGGGLSATRKMVVLQ